MQYPWPVQVQHEGRWLAGTLLAARRDSHGPWRGLVTYTDPTCTLSWYHGGRRLSLRPPPADDSVRDGDV